MTIHVHIDDAFVAVIWLLAAAVAVLAVYLFGVASGLRQAQNIAKRIEAECDRERKERP
jgi:hypothetical protein